MTFHRLIPLAVVALASCGPERARPLGLDSVAPLESPAGEGSGEPYLSTTEDAVYLSWLEAAADGGHDLWIAELGPEGWSERRHVAYGDAFFVNWADFPSVNPAPDGSLWAHWLQGGSTGGYDYGIRIARSTDGGRSWSEPWTPHEDGTPTEHGFVSAFAVGEEMAFAWLDGRQFAPGPDGAPATEEMTLRFRVASADGEPGPETLLDRRICDCCQTDAASTRSGPVLVYRDRTEAEIRDIYITRWTPDGWTDGVAVHEDGWEIPGCPVNGPAVAASGDRVVVAWFTGVGGTGRVLTAFSEDGGASFGAPVQVDGGDPVGRVDVLFTEGGEAWVSWLEQTGEERAEVRLAQVSPSGIQGPPATIAEVASARATGFPRIVETPWAPGTFVVAWTEVDAAETTGLRLAQVGPGS